MVAEVETYRIARQLGEAAGVSLTEINGRRTGDEGWVMYVREGVGGDLLARTVAIPDRDPSSATFKAA